MTTKLERESDYALAVSNLAGAKEGQEIYAIVRSVSASGMSRTISFYYVEEDGDLSNVTWSIGQILGYKMTTINGFNAIRVNGVGMDMCFSVIYDLGRVLKDNGYYFKSRQI
jgi:hypothetical protein